MNEHTLAQYVDTLITEDIVANDEAPVENTSTVIDNMFWVYLESGERYRVEIWKEA